MRVARIWGIEIAVHASWLVIYALITWSLAVGYFPGELPGRSPAVYWVSGALTALVFFLSVLVHELGHSWVALRHGIPIRGITLFVFGGVAQIGREPASPVAELRIAIAGPLTSIAVAAACAGAAVAAREVAVLAGPATWLARVNLMVALFNLVPGFPLDGGRVLRAAVWYWTGSFERATRAATASGRLFAALLMAIGAFSAIGGNLVGGVWLVLIGWFLEKAAGTAEAEAAVRVLLRDVAVASVMSRECARVPGGRTVGDLVRAEVLGAGRRCFLVVDGGRLAGLVTLHQIKDVPAERRDAVTAAEVMTPAAQLAVVGPGDSVLTALQKMDDADAAQLPVVEDRELLGLIGREQILQYVRTRAELGV